MIDGQLFTTLGLTMPARGPARCQDQLERLGYRNLGESTGWPAGDPRLDVPSKLLCSGNGYRLWVSPENKTFHYSHCEG